MSVKVAPLLDRLADGTRVGVVTMLGSLCPVTLGHTMSFVKARDIILGAPGVDRPAHLETFGEVLGYISLNGDRHVGAKLQQKGELHIDAGSRKHLVGLATADYPWMDLETDSGRTIHTLREGWPKLTFIEFVMNGADDVVKYQKYRGATKNQRFIVMGRPGYTDQVKQGMVDFKVDADAGYFILGPELPDISSSAVRNAFRTLADSLHPDVIQWCLLHGPYAPQAAVPAAATPAACAPVVAALALPQWMVHCRADDGVNSTSLRTRADPSRDYCSQDTVKNGVTVEVLEPRITVNGMVRVRLAGKQEGWLRQEVLHVALSQWMVHRRAADGVNCTALRTRADPSRDYCNQDLVNNGATVEVLEPRFAVNGLVRVRLVGKQEGWLRQEVLHLG